MKSARAIRVKNLEALEVNLVGPNVTERHTRSKSLDAACTLKTSLHRDPNHAWTTNDVHDIDAWVRRSRAATSSCPTGR